MSALYTCIDLQLIKTNDRRLFLTTIKTSPTDILALPVHPCHVFSGPLRPGRQPAAVQLAQSRVVPRQRPRLLQGGLPAGVGAYELPFCASGEEGRG